MASVQHHTDCRRTSAGAVQEDIKIFTEREWLAFRRRSGWNAANRAIAPPSAPLRRKGILMRQTKTPDAAALVDHNAARAILNGHCADPFAQLGLQDRDGAVLLSVFVPGADSVTCIAGDRKSTRLNSSHPV